MPVAATLQQFQQRSGKLSRALQLHQRREHLSGLLQNFYHLVRVVPRVHRHIGEKLCTNHGGREAAQVNSPVGKLLSQLRGDARPVTAHDSNGLEGTRNVKTHLRGCSGFPVTPEWRDEHHSLAGFCTPGDDELQVCARFPQLGQHVRKGARSVFDGGRPHIDMFHIFHERIHNSSSSSLDVHNAYRSCESIADRHTGARIMSASLIGRFGSSAFRRSTNAVLMSLTGSRFSSESAPRPFHHGVRGQGDQSKGRPCRYVSGRSKRTYDLTSSIAPRGTSCHRVVELAFSLSG